MMAEYWRDTLAGMVGGNAIVESVLGADELPAARRVEEREHRDEHEPASCVEAVAAEFARHFHTHGVLPPAEHMFEVAEENDRIAEERAVEESGATGDAHWRFAVGDDAIVESMLGEAA